MKPSGFYVDPFSKVAFCLFETQVRFTSNALAFNLKCTCVLIKTYLRLRGNVLAFLSANLYLV